MTFAGVVDWAETHHDVHVQDENGKKLAGGRLSEGIEGINRFHDLVAAHAEDPGDVVIGIETHRGLFAAALVNAGYQVFAVNPMSASRYRDRHVVSGAKSDPGDAKVLADLVRTDRHNHRPVVPDSDLAVAIKVLARAHQSMIWNRRRQLNQLRSTLREFYPAALAAFDDLGSGDAAEVLKLAPKPRLGAALSRTQITAALRRGGRTRRLADRAAQIQAALRAAQLQPPPVIAAAMGTTVASLVSVTSEMTRQIAVLEQQLAADFEQHPDAEIVRSLPRTWDCPRRPGAQRVRRRAGPLPRCQVSQELRRHIAHHPSSQHQRSRTSPPRPQQAPRRRHLPLGLLRHQHQPRRPPVLQPAPRRRRHPPPSAPRTRQRLVGYLHGRLASHALYHETTAWAHRTSTQRTNAA